MPRNLSGKEQGRVELKLLGLSPKDVKAQQKAVEKQKKISLVDALKRLNAGTATPDDLAFLDKNVQGRKLITPAHISLADRLSKQITAANLSSWFNDPNPSDKRG